MKVIPEGCAPGGYQSRSRWASCSRPETCAAACKKTLSASDPHVPHAATACCDTSDVPLQGVAHLYTVNCNIFSRILNHAVQPKIGLSGKVNAGCAPKEMASFMDQSVPQIITLFASKNSVSPAMIGQSAQVCTTPEHVEFASLKFAHVSWHWSIGWMWQLESKLQNTA